ncbi:hypothetical protein BKA67DRAFT_538448 [Truncatella angustata]|uniref:ATP-dependent RNA helicase DHX8 n=1 Tax=Truncatella angustata TaxID=152316 RepID=A0A9P8UEF8_9PEZI|nr:uncharacterized protein BKA67DRAFT_538448 [Truncatella angustata]KAH6648409.1 hypothetical protein BKA67DRAFT_538448 [Truncatella angustata]KAH8204846.1 hypothetical protein TruAng_001035 [Truncatella angustata]
MDTTISNVKHQHSSSKSSLKIRHRQIRALCDEETITVYQAYNAEIASHAVQHQKLNASPLFKPGRMTWIKPSWCWMMYRSGYSFKDKNQERILALKMRRTDFLVLLEKAVLATKMAARGTGDSKGVARDEGEEERRSDDVRVQWDPERSMRLERLEYRSIQIGIRGDTRTHWIMNSIVAIEDVTEMAQSLKAALDEDPRVSEQELVQRGLLPQEKPVEASKILHEILEMD